MIEAVSPQDMNSVDSITWAINYINKELKKQPTGHSTYTISLYKKFNKYDLKKILTPFAKVGWTVDTTESEAGHFIYLTYRK